jgi:transcriptional regulator with XRE-family HTH domain
MSEIIPARPDVQAAPEMPAPPPEGYFGQWLKAQRADAGLSQEQLAHELGCTRNTIQNIESGRTNPRHVVFVRAMEFFGVPLPYQV